ncbi:MAG TPA: DUF6484 domain-containing protein [Polyangium sp.]|nr:DUF6484 domain-containing protein [Polyangium sp.]
MKYPSSTQDAEITALTADETDAATTPETDTPAEQLLDLILEAHEARSPDEPLPETIDGVVLARIVSVDASGCVWVRHRGAPENGVPARAMTRVTNDDVGRDAALLFEAGHRDKPLVMGLLFPGQTTVDSTRSPAENQATVDGRRVVLSAEREIVLECGEASITLTRAGKILIKGTYVLTRSSGTNRIQGGSVQIN